MMYSLGISSFKRCMSLTALSAVMVLNGCSFAPGISAFGMRGDSNVRLAGDKKSTPPVEVKEIDADLLLSMKESALSAPSLVHTDLMQSKPYVYEVGPHDVLSITVFGHPTLTIPAGSYRSAEESGYKVEADGTLYFPYAGVVSVAGKNLSQIRVLLTKKLSRYIENAQLSVRVASFASQRVYVVGEVKSPGSYPIRDIKPTVLELVNQAGGFSVESDRQKITLTRAGKVYNIDLQSLYEGGDVSQNIVLHDGDIVNIPDRSANQVFVLGEVASPGTLVMNKKRMSLAEALSSAGGLNQNTASPGYVYVMRGAEEQQEPEVFHLDIRSPHAMILAERFALNARDVVYVDTASVVRWNRFISNIVGTVRVLRDIDSLQESITDNINNGDQN